MAKPSISVIIPTFNAGKRFRIALQRILEQQIALPFELIVVDSGSSDETLRICSEFPVRLLQVARRSFHHSDTRNWAIAQAMGDYIVLTVQDAIPADVNWLARLVVPLTEDGRVAGAYGRQMAWPEHEQLVQRYHEVWHGDKERVVQDLAGREIVNVPISERQRLARFDNVTSCIRRDVWERIPFPAVRYGEDFAWAWEVLQQGYRLIYEPDAAVWHSHQRGLWHGFRRSYLLGDALCRVFGSTFPEETVLEQITPFQLARWFTESIMCILRTVRVMGTRVTRDQVADVMNNFPSIERGAHRWMIKRSVLAILLAGHGTSCQRANSWWEILWDAVTHMSTDRMTGEAFQDASRRLLRQLARQNLDSSSTDSLVHRIATWRPAYSLASLARLVIGYPVLGFLSWKRGYDLIASWLFDVLVQADWQRVWAVCRQLAVGRLWYADQMVRDVLFGFLILDSDACWSKRYVSRVWLYGVIRALGLCLGETFCRSSGKGMFKIIDHWLAAGIA